MSNHRNDPGPYFTRRMGPVVELDGRDIAGVTHADGGGWRLVRITEDPMPSTVLRPAGSLGSGLTFVLDGPTGFVKAEKPTGEVFRRGEYVDPGFWHRLVGEAEPISHRLGTPRPCPLHGYREPQTITRESALPPHTPWTVQVWGCQPGARFSELTTERHDDGRLVRCAGRYVDAPTGRVLGGVGGMRGATHVEPDADPYGWYRGEAISEDVSA